jgi:superfamily I DNA/RNA helicase
VQQLAIVRAPLERHITVVATPGAGKSKVLVDRVANLIESNVPASSIRVATFFREAAAEVASRLAVGVSVSTIHSYCLELAEAYEPVLRKNAVTIRNMCVLEESGGLSGAILQTRRELSSEVLRGSSLPQTSISTDCCVP